MTDAAAPVRLLAAPPRGAFVALVAGAIAGAALVFPREIPVELVNASRRTAVISWAGEPPITLAPLERTVRRAPRWRFTRYAYRLVPDGGASRANAVLGPRDFLLYERLRLALTPDGAALRGS